MGQDETLPDTGASTATSPSLVPPLLLPQVEAELAACLFWELREFLIKWVFMHFFGFRV